MGHPVAKIDAKPLRDLVQLHDLSIPEISRYTGISISALHNWIRSGKMPAQMEYTCIGLLARLKPSRAPKPNGPDSDSRTLIVQLPEGKTDQAYGMLDLLGANYKPATQALTEAVQPPVRRGPKPKPK